VYGAAVGSGECENCGHAVEDLAPVKRMYVVPETWDQAGSETTLDAVEQWCWSCRTQYPNEEVSA
jgi:hypothetical protein